MRTTLCGLILLISVAVLAATKLQPLNVKVGLWEVSQTVTTSGQLPISADALSKLSPEQRARIEERMKANSAPTTRTTTHKSCMTKEKLQTDPMFLEKSNCTWTVLTSTSSKADLRGVCVEQDVKAHMALHVEALNSENVKGSSQGSVSGGDHTMNANSTFIAKWVGSACGNVK
jgi:hypothetical protein